MKHTLYALLAIGMITCSTSHAAKLKVFNKTDRIIIGHTAPLAGQCAPSQTECSVAPYQILKRNAVTFDAQGHNIHFFIWHGVVGPTYKAEIHMQPHENKNVEIHSNGRYKYDGKMQTAIRI